MNKAKTIWHLKYALSLIIIILIIPMACANEHPKKTEHPEKKTAEHPEKKKAEHPEGEIKPLTKEDLAEAIEMYVKKDAALRGGYFMVYDSKVDKPLVLVLDKVHKDRLSMVGPKLYFACADFKTPEGKVYDLDVFMKGWDKHHLKVTEISVHKEAGKERYTWYEEEGIWKKKPVTGSVW